MKKISAGFMLLLFLAGCSLMTKAPDKTIVGSTNSTQSLSNGGKVKLLYATNRSRVAGNNSDYYNSFGNRNVDSLHYGMFMVSIPHIHEKGKIEDRTLFQRLGGKERDDDKHFTIKGHEVYSKAGFYKNLNEFIGDSRDSNQAFIFIHGYNTDFLSATYRAAQMFFDLKAVGVPILFSWPSKGSFMGYYADQTSVDRTVSLFQQFMKETIQATKGKRLNIIAHSMGNRLLVKSLDNLPKDFPEAKFENIIMAAPDVSVSEFDKKYFQSVVHKANKLTLYSSSKDKALAFSKYANFFSRRLGFAGNALFIRNPMETVDVSDLSCDDILGHTCFAMVNPVLEDIESTLTQSSSSGVKRITHYFKSFSYFTILPSNLASVNLSL